jgi:hypothetical protein
LIEEHNPDGMTFRIQSFKLDTSLRWYDSRCLGSSQAGMTVVVWVPAYAGMTSSFFDMAFKMQRLQKSRNRFWEKINKILSH